MRAFARLLDCLVYTQSRNRKVALLGHYFRTAPDPDRGWALAALTDGVPIRLPLRRMLSDLVTRFIDPVLYQLSRDYVGDTAETVALLWPDDRSVVLPASQFTSTPDPSPQGGGELRAASAVAPIHGEAEKRTSPLPSTGKGRGDESEQPRQLVLRLTPTPSPSPQGGGDIGGNVHYSDNQAKLEKSVLPTRPSPRPSRREGKGEGRRPAPVLAVAPHPNPLPARGEREVSPSPLPLTGRGRGWGEVGHNSGEPPGLSLGAVVEAMTDGTTAERTERLGRLLDQLDATGRWALLKLIGGAPRVGVSARLARTALAESYGRDVSEIEEIWHALEPPYLDLFQWLDGSANRPDPGAKPVFRPVMLAHPIEEEDWPRLSPEDFVAEWKWDGIRVQVAARGSDVRMFLRQGADI